MVRFHFIPRRGKPVPKKDNPSAMYDMGEMYEIGCNNLKQNTKKGKYWIRQAVNNGHFFALLQSSIQTFTL